MTFTEALPPPEPNVGKIPPHPAEASTELHCEQRILSSRVPDLWIRARIVRIKILELCKLGGGGGAVAAKVGGHHDGVAVHPGVEGGAGDLLTADRAEVTT